MNSNDIWLLTTSIILFCPCSEGTVVTAANVNSFLDNAVSENTPSNVKLFLDSRTKRAFAMVPQHSGLSFKNKMTSKNVDLVVTAPQTEVSQVFYETHSDQPIQSLLLSMKEISQSDFTLATEKDDPKVYYAFRVIFRRRYEMDKSGRSMHTEMGAQVLWDAATGGKSLGKYSFLSTRYYRGEMLKQFHTLEHSKTENATTHAKPTVNHAASSSPCKATGSDYAINLPPRLVKREVPISSEAVETPDLLTVLGKNTAERNGTDDNLDFLSTDAMYPVTKKPEDGNEFVPGMNKWRFITVISTSLMLTLCVAAIAVYYIRRRRLRRAIDPERQSLIPFRVTTGIYYDQTGSCF